MSDLTTTLVDDDDNDHNDDDDHDHDHEDDGNIQHHGPTHHQQQQHQHTQEQKEEDEQPPSQQATDPSIPSISIRYTILLPAVLLIIAYNFQNILRLWEYYYYIRPISKDNNDNNETPILQCNYYMAESTIPNGGWGIFTRNALYQNDIIKINDGELCIPIIDVTIQHGPFIQTLYYNYMWNADISGSNNEGGGRTIFRSSHSSTTSRVQTLPGNVLNVISGIGTLTNGHPMDYNIVPYQIPIPHPPLLQQHHHNDDVSDHSQSSTTTKFAISRHTTPTAGSMTYYHNLQYFAYNNKNNNNQNHINSHSRIKKNLIVQAGGELIINYGSGWDQRYDFTKYRIHPKHQPKQNIRTINDLDNNGYCIDHIQSSYPNISQLVPHAGYGGLARRNLLKNTIITPIPVIPIHRYGLYMSNDDDDNTTNDATDDNNNNSNKNIRQRNQLLLNYCFGHVQSDLLLVPYGPGIHYINHHSTQYNAMIRWSTLYDDTNNNNDNHNKPKRHRPKFVIDPNDITFEQMIQDQPAGILLLELIAIRDIQQGEEILIHYGIEWEIAYQKHVQEWEEMNNNINSNNASNDQEYVYAYEMNQRKDNVILRTELEQKENPYPYNVQLECYYVPQFYKEIKNNNNNGDQQQFDFDIDLYKNQHHEQNFQHFHPNQLRSCQILHRSAIKRNNNDIKNVDEDDRNEEYVYTIQMIVSDQHSTIITIRNVPRTMITFRDVPYTQDQYMKHVFRHEIQLPNDIFPYHWRKERKMK